MFMMQSRVSSQWCEPRSLRSCLGQVAAVSCRELRPRFPPGRMAWLNGNHSLDRLSVKFSPEGHGEHHRSRDQWSNKLKQEGSGRFLRSLEGVVSTRAEKMYTRLLTLGGRCLSCALPYLPCCTWPGQSPGFDLPPRGRTGTLPVKPCPSRDRARLPSSPECPPSSVQAP